MNNKFFKITLVLFFFGASAYVFSKPITPNTVQVSAEGKYEAEPDTALMQFAISAEGKTPEIAYQRATTAAEKIQALLTNNGIDPKSAELTTFQLQPVYNYSNPTRYLTGYRVNSNVSIRITDFGKINALLDGLKNLDISGEQSFNYTLQNIDAAKKLALQSAYKQALFLAKTIAKAGQKEVGEMLYASVDNLHHQPVFHEMVARTAMPEKSSAPTALFGTQKIIITANVSVLFALK